MGSAVLTLQLAVTPTLSQCQLCHCPNVQDRGEVASGVQILMRFHAGSDRQGAASRVFPCQMELSLQDAAVYCLLPVINPKPVDPEQESSHRRRTCQSLLCVRQHQHNYYTCVLSSPYAADRNHQRVDGYPQLWRVCASIH